MVWTNKPAATLAIAQAGEYTESFVCGDYCRGSVQFPSAMTATTGLWQSSNDGTNWTTTAGETTFAITADATKKLPANLFAAKYARLQLNAAEAAARSLLIFLAGPAAS